MHCFSFIFPGQKQRHTKNLELHEPKFYPCWCAIQCTSLHFTHFTRQRSDISPSFADIIDIWHSCEFVCTGNNFLLFTQVGDFKCGSRGWDRRSGPPLENYKNIGFLSNTGLDPLKITKLPSQHSMLGHHRGIWILPPPSPHQTKIKKKRCRSCTPSDKTFWIRVWTF